ncbi:cation:proton antiporter [Saccharothrix longispora]|uniref:Kef-type K+ transport system membrane component KefB n=1 Tax=Saccharothrix longispora TaxID=33920 RepID=A0ABU1PTM8_9PSEU|nr:cation:proton antiporter [Saccharothrix longispora]MDR6594010.1 Kef-type K+ transport system membrane component KefB [Saccharothrix longispora]
MQHLDAAELNSRTFLALAVILVAVRAVGWLVGKIGQPRVLGEITAGILLGPSALGMVFPGSTEHLFPPQVVQSLNVLAQIGLVIFMLLVGLEIDLRALRGQGRKVTLISQASMLVPIALSVPLSLWLYPRFGEGTGRLEFSLFMAAAMAITAFPVLSRLLQESDLLRTRVGVVSLLCAATNDVVAWFLLAVVVAVVNSSGPLDVVLTLAWSAVYVALMLVVVRPLLHRWGRPPIWGVLVIAVLSAWVTDLIGIHAIFGAFMAGAVMPRDPTWLRAVEGKLGSVTSVLLLPVFFGLVGISTRVDLLSTPALWLTVLLVVAVATAGKLSGSALTARLTGEPWPESLLIGVLMNTRGLTEVVILTVGVQLGVVSPPLFAIMVLMALATTFMAAPLIAALKRRTTFAGVDEPAGAR